MAAVAPSFAAGGTADNSSASGLVSMMISAAHLDIMSGRYLILSAVTVAALLLLTMSKKLDPQEPPLVQSSIPFIGHMIGLIRHQAKYHVLLQRKSRQPIATLSILNGKVYAVWDPVLVAAGLRNKDLSFTPFMQSMVKPLFLSNDEVVSIVNDPALGLTDTFMAAIAPSLAGDNLRRLNHKALELLEDYFNNTEKVTDVPNLWLWARGLIMGVTSKALFGEVNPFENNPKLEQSLWDFQEGLPRLFLGILPAWLAPAGHRARAHLQSTLHGYYAGYHDTDASTAALVRARAGVLRGFGVPAAEMAKLEMMLPYAANTNTVPTLFWLATFVFSRPALAAALRAEAALLAAPAGGGKVALDLADVEARCPRLLAAYRETLRLTNHQTSARRAVRDTVLADGRGREYLLKKGTDVHLCIATAHLAEEVWGRAADEFDAERFLAGGPGAGKAQRLAYQPFGGGAHLCPGRNFALVEILAVMVTLLLGYEMGTQDGGEWRVPSYAQWSMVDSIHKPVDDGAGMGVRIVKRKGWENVRWRYKM